MLAALAGVEAAAPHEGTTSAAANCVWNSICCALDPLDLFGSCYGILSVGFVRVLCEALLLCGYIY